LDRCRERLPYYEMPDYPPAGGVTNSVP
jgi:hypothetical protein